MSLAKRLEPKSVRQVDVWLFRARQVGEATTAGFLLVALLRTRKGLAISKKSENGFDCDN